MEEPRRSPGAAVIIPFFNEEARFRRSQLLQLAAEPSIDLIVVDDGSRDRTAALLAETASEAAGKIRLVKLETNVGKGEAVRRGMQTALEDGREAVGFTDADFSTRPSEIVALLDQLVSRDDLDVLIASRVSLIGRRVERSPARHYLGRIFATVAANILRAPFYDTQCGAKLFRATPMLANALAQPFVSRWAFDIELLGRLLIGTPSVARVPIDRIREVPLEEWVDTGGSKVTVGAMAKTLLDLGRIEVELGRLRSAVAAGTAKGDGRLRGEGP